VVFSFAKSRTELISPGFSRLALLEKQAKHREACIDAEINAWENRARAQAYMTSAYARAAREGVNVTTVLERMAVAEEAERLGVPEAVIWDQKRQK